MKRIFFLLWLVLSLFSNARAQVNLSNYVDSGFYNFNDTFKLLTTQIFDTYKSQFGLTTYDQMQLVTQQFLKVDSTDSIDGGSVQSRYQQYYKDYEVEGK